MAYSLITIVTVALTLIAVKQVKIEKEPINQSLYFPNKKMVKTFNKTPNEEGFIHIVDKIKDGRVQIKQVDSQTRVVMIYSISADSIKLIYTKELGYDDFEDDYIEDLIPNRDDFILKSPIEIGTNWSDGDGGIYEIIKTNAVVETPAGTFEAIVVRYTNDEFTVKEYYAKDIGLIKIIVNNFGEYELIQIK